jgi:Protein of unknown function (DUF1761)
LRSWIAGWPPRLRSTSGPGALLLGLALWIGFPFVLWTGAVVHEKTPWKLAAIHAGDWLPKLLAVAMCRVIVFADEVTYIDSVSLLVAWSVEPGDMFTTMSSPYPLAACSSASG